MRMTPPTPHTSPFITTVPLASSNPNSHKFRTWLFGQTSYFQLIHFDESFSDLSLMKIDFWKWSLWVAHWRTRLKVGTKST